MYDTVNIWIDRVDMSGGNTLDILPCLSDITEIRSERGHSFTGKIQGYSVRVYEHGISLNGSLAKFFFAGENTSTMTRRATQDAIRNLSDVLHVDMKQAKVCRADVATVINTKYKPEAYFGYLGDKPHFRRSHADATTLYYKTNKRVLIFYDKAAEAKSNIHAGLDGCNLLRYELRFIKGLNEQLKAEVLGATLYEPAFYEKIVMRLYDEYKTIQKIKKQNVMTKDIETVREAETALFAHLLHQSGKSTIDDYISQLKEENKFSKQRLYELRKKLNTIYASPKGEESELGHELDKWIYEQTKYAR